jgi:hypothetical protein
MRIVRSHAAAKLLAAAAVALVAGCASFQSAPESTIDAAKIAQVERSARLFGTQVIWVNYPTRQVDVAK